MVLNLVNEFALYLTVSFYNYLITFFKINSNYVFIITKELFFTTAYFLIKYLEKAIQGVDKIIVITFKVKPIIKTCQTEPTIP